MFYGRKSKVYRIVTSSSLLSFTGTTGRDISKHRMCEKKISYRLGQAIGKLSAELKSHLWIRSQEGKKQLSFEYLDGPTNVNETQLASALTDLFAPIAHRYDHTYDPKKGEEPTQNLEAKAFLAYIDQRETVWRTQVELINGPIRYRQLDPVFRITGDTSRALGIVCSSPLDDSVTTVVVRFQ